MSTRSNAETHHLDRINKLLQLRPEMPVIHHGIGQLFEELLILC